jgi:hypothetical protein
MTTTPRNEKSSRRANGNADDESRRSSCVSPTPGLAVLPPPGVRPPRVTLLLGLPTASGRVDVPTVVGPLRPRPNAATMSAAEQASRGVPRVTLHIDESLRLPPIEALRIAGTDVGPVAAITPAPLSRSTATEIPRPHPVDFSDAESRRVLDGAADALVGVLARLAAREDFADWLARQQERP